jgi:hypothetical protein
VVGKPAATVIISSPGSTLLSPSRGEVNVENATRFAEDPELTNRQKPTSRNWAREVSRREA